MLPGGAKGLPERDRGTQEPHQSENAMNTLMTVGQQMFNWTWKTSVQAGILVVLLLLLQRFLGHWLTPRLRYALSLLVLCRLLLPVLPPSSLSLANVFTRTAQSAESPVISTTVAPPVHA